MLFMMKRTQLQLDDETFERLRTRAHAERRSIASLVREALQRADPQPALQQLSDFPFVGAGRSASSTGRPISEDHDRVLADAAAPRRRARRP